jgi:putative membrane protein insertion efficiency factor
MNQLLRFLLRAYQLTISPLMTPSCRFHPSCSNYALEALQVHGAARGSLLAAKRLCRCHPWHPGGHDPVPPADGKTNSSTTACGCNHS